MFEIIFGAVCLGVLAVEIIEVRQKCGESYLGTWYETDPFQAPVASLTGVRQDKRAPSAHRRGQTYTFKVHVQPQDAEPHRTDPRQAQLHSTFARARSR
jgi:hypothetical protein